MLFSDMSMDDERALSAPRIVLMGCRRCGKTSMERVVFGKMSPHETLFVASSSSPTLRLVANNDLVQFAIFDIPGGEDIPGGSDLSRLSHNGAFLTPLSVFSRCVALCYVIDATGDVYRECAKLAEVLYEARQVNPRLSLDVFIHKVDGDAFSTEEQREEVRRNVLRCVKAEFEMRRDDAKELARQNSEIFETTDEPLETVNLSLTSIYDNSVFEAFSKVVQRLVPSRPSLERMLDLLVTTCDMEKSFLFDIQSKVYVATDTGPVDPSSYELCADAVDVVMDVSNIYGANQSALDSSQSVHLTKPKNGSSEEKNSYASNSATVALSNGMTLFIADFDASLCLVCLLRTECLERLPLIKYNLGAFRTALQKIAELGAEN